MKRFLQFIVEQTLAGHGQALKEYTIAVEVFERDESFDPTTSALVRVEAGRLRRTLKQYYLTHGRGDKVTFEDFVQLRADILGRGLVELCGFILF